MSPAKNLILASLLFLPMAVTSAEVISKSSAMDVKQTMDKLESIVKKKGMTVFNRINHQKNAKSVDMQMPASEVLIFGNPKIGTKIMLGNTAAGLDLPVRILIYAAQNGTTTLSYHNPQELKSGCIDAGCAAIDKMEKALNAITNAATK